MGLKFDYNNLIKDFINEFYKELEIALNAWENEVYHYVKFDGSEVNQKAEVNTYIKRTENALIGFLEANTTVLADAYGTGTLMNITDNPLFKEYYKKKEERWNPLRTNKTIVGRKIGGYIDIFGNQRHGSVKDNEKPKPIKFVKPIPPSNSIKIANSLLDKTYIPAALRNARDKINFSKYLIEEK